MFMDWHLQLGLSAMEMSEIGRNMEMIAKTTGITGKNLESAMKKSEALLKGLRERGVLNPKIAGNIPA